MVATRSTESRLDGLEKATGDLEKGVDSANASIGNLNAQITMIQTQLTTILKELRAKNSDPNKGSTSANSTDGPESNPTATGGARL